DRGRHGCLKQRACELIGGNRSRIKKIGGYAKERTEGEHVFFTLSIISTLPNLLIKAEPPNGLSVRRLQSKRQAPISLEILDEIHPERRLRLPGSVVVGSHAVSKRLF